MPDGPAGTSVRAAPPWTVLPRQVTEHVFKQHMRDCVEESEGAAWEQYWRDDLGKQGSVAATENKNEGPLQDCMLHQF